MKNIFLGIGSNLKNRGSNLDKALTLIAEFIGPVVASSSVYETEPWGFQSEDQFLNMVVKVETDLSPSGLMDRILMIESHLGRIRSEEQYSSRVIDIDVIFYEDMIFDSNNLRIPHPKMHERRFVLVPLCEIAPELLHPVLKRSMISLLKSCKDKGKSKLYKSNFLD